MNAEKNAIKLLSITALLLLSALIFLSPPAKAEVTAKDADYQLATLMSASGSDALYVADMRVGVMVVFAYDAGRRVLLPVSIRRVDDAFAGR